MSAREFYEEARARVGEIIAACEKDAPPSPPRKHGRYAVLPFAVASVALTIAALAFAAIRVSEHEEVTAIAAFVMAFTLPLCAGMRVLLDVALKTPVHVFCGTIAICEAAIAVSCIATTVFPLALFDGLAVQAAAMFASDAIFCNLAVWMAVRVSRQTATDGSSVLEDARSLKRGLDSALACYDTDSGLGEYNNLHGFRKRLAEVEAAYLAELY